MADNFEEKPDGDEVDGIAPATTPIPDGEVPEETSPETNETTADTDGGTQSEGAEKLPEVTFLSKEDMQALEADIQANPELRLVYDRLIAAHKNMQKGFTKKTTDIAEERKALTDYKRKAEQYDKLYGDKAFQDFYKSYMKGDFARSQQPPPAIEHKTLGWADIAKQNLQDITPEEEEFYKRLGSVLDKGLGNIVSPLAGKLNDYEEATAKADIAKKYSYLELDGENGFWDDIKSIYQKFRGTGLTWDDAVWLATKDFQPEYWRQAAAEEAKAKTKTPKTDKAVVLGGGQKAEPKTGYSQAEIAKMSPDEYAEKMGLKRE